MAERADFKEQCGLPEQEPFAVRSVPQLPSWLQVQDLTEEDLTYIQPFLIACFDDWLQQADRFPWLAEPIRLYHPDGTPIASSGSAQQESALPPCWSEESLGPNAVGAALRTHRPAMSRAAEHNDPFLTAWDCIAVPVFTRNTGILCAVLAVLLPAGSAQAADEKLLQAAAVHFRTCLYRRFEYVFLGGMLRDQSLTRREQRRRDILFEALSRFNDHMEVDQVLTEMMHSLEQLYPKCLADLFLSQDYRTANEKVKQLDFQEADMELCKRAFLENVLCEQKFDDRHRLAIPLTGKQGVYGVLRLETPEAEFDEVDQRFLSKLSGAAGAAFEKARLHEQSNAMVAELRLINELSRRLNSRLNKLQETIEYASSQLLSIFHAEFCWILQFDAQKNQFVVVSSNVPKMLGHTFAVNYGFIGVMWNTKEPIILPDYGAAYPIQSKVMADTNSKSLLASPLVLNGEIIGAVMVSHREPNHFTYENYKLLQVLSVHLGLAVSNASLHAEVRRLVITDNVTGLFTRHYLNERISRKQQRDGSGSLIVLDIDHFKQVNDNFGHQVGDEILQQVSHIIRTSIRDADIAARWGGEELAVYMPQLGLDQTKKVAERIRERVENETFPRVTVSCGVSNWLASDDKVSVESLFYSADMALYEAKRLGRNRVETG